MRREPPATRCGLLKVRAHTARLDCSGGRVARLFMRSVHRHRVGRRQSVARLDCTDRCPKQQQPVAISAHYNLLSIGWICIGCKICSCIASHKQYKIILNVTRHIFLMILYTMHFYNLHLEGIATPFSDYPTQRWAAEVSSAAVAKGWQLSGLLTTMPGPHNKMLGWDVDLETYKIDHVFMVFIPS